MTQSHTLVSTSALESMDRMVRELQAERDELLSFARLAIPFIGLVNPGAAKCEFVRQKGLDAIAACTESKQVMG